MSWPSLTVLRQMSLTKNYESFISVRFCSQCRASTVQIVAKSDLIEAMKLKMFFCNLFSPECLKCSNRSMPIK